MNINENKVKNIEKNGNVLRFTYKISHILAAMLPKVMNMVPSLGSGHLSGVSHKNCVICIIMNIDETLKIT